MRILTLDAALESCSAGLVVDGAVVANRSGEGGRGQAAILPLLAQQVLDGVPAHALDHIAVTIGPGSFTGIRAALALAHGIGLAAGVPVVGVTTGAALAAGTATPAGWQVWAVIGARRGHVFLQRGTAVEMLPIAALPVPDRPTLLVGNAAAEVDVAGARVAGTDAPAPDAIARASLSAPCPAEPLYVEPPRTTAAPP